MATDQQPYSGAPPGYPPGGDWFGGFMRSMGMPNPAELMASLQQLNHNLEVMQGPELLGQLERLNGSLEAMAPLLLRLTTGLESFQANMWGNKGQGDGSG